MKRYTFATPVLTGLVALVLSSMVMPAILRADNSKICKNQGRAGGDIPTPFGTANVHMDLSQDEIYVLVGTVHFFDKAPMLEVDLKKQPWLASRKRASFPYFTLGKIPSAHLSWNQFEGVSIKITARATAIRNLAADEYSYSMTLQPLADPVLEKTGIKR